MDARQTIINFIKRHHPELIDQNTGEVNCAELGRLSKLHQPTLHRFFRGETDSPRLKLIEAIAGGLRAPVYALLQPDDNNHKLNSVALLNKAPILEYSDLSSIDAVLSDHIENIRRKKDLFVMSSVVSSRCFYLQIDSDANHPHISIGDFVLFDPDRKPAAGDFALATGSHGPMVGRIAINDDDSLSVISENKLIAVKIKSDLSNLVGVKLATYRDGSQ